MPPPLDFSNISIAYQDKSKKELSRTYWLFKLLNNNTLTGIGSGLTGLALKMRLPIESMVKSTVYAQFCGGDSIESCEPIVKRLLKSHILTNLDYAVEGKETDAENDQTLEEILHMIDFAAGNEGIPFFSLKITGLGRFNILAKRDSGEDLSDEEQDEFNRVLNRLDTICHAAEQKGLTLFIDAEESWIQDSIDWLAMEMMKKYNKYLIIERKFIAYKLLVL